MFHLFFYIIHNKEMTHLVSFCFVVMRSWVNSTKPTKQHIFFFLTFVFFNFCFNFVFCLYFWGLASLHLSTFLLLHFTAKHFLSLHNIYLSADSDCVRKTHFTWMKWHWNLQNRADTQPLLSGSHSSKRSTPPSSLFCSTQSCTKFKLYTPWFRRALKYFPQARQSSCALKG